MRATITGSRGQGATECTHPELFIDNNNSYTTSTMYTQTVYTHKNFKKLPKDQGEHSV